MSRTETSKDEYGAGVGVAYALCVVKGGDGICLLDAFELDQPATYSLCCPKWNLENPCQRLFASISADTVQLLKSFKCSFARLQSLQI